MFASLVLIKSVVSEGIKPHIQLVLVVKWSERAAVYSPLSDEVKFALEQAVMVQRGVKV